MSDHSDRLDQMLNAAKTWRGQQTPPLTYAQTLARRPVEQPSMWSILFSVRPMLTAMATAVIVLVVSFSLRQKSSVDLSVLNDSTVAMQAITLPNDVSFGNAD